MGFEQRQRRTERADREPSRRVPCALPQAHVHVISPSPSGAVVRTQLAGASALDGGVATMTHGGAATIEVVQWRENRRYRVGGMRRPAPRLVIVFTPAVVSERIGKGYTTSV